MPVEIKADIRTPFSLTAEVRSAFGREKPDEPTAEPSVSATYDEETGDIVMQSTRN